MRPFRWRVHVRDLPSRRPTPPKPRRFARGEKGTAAPGTTTRFPRTDAGSMKDTPILTWLPGAIVVDCDGTLMDSERHWEAARETVLREYGVEPSAEFGNRTKGLHYSECGRLMTEAAVLAPERAEEVTTQLLD